MKTPNHPILFACVSVALAVAGPTFGEQLAAEFSLDSHPDYQRSQLRSMIWCSDQLVGVSSIGSLISVSPLDGSITNIGRKLVGDLEEFALHQKVQCSSDNQWLTFVSTSKDDGNLRLRFLM